MKQREIERLSGWIALACWLLFVVLVAIIGGEAASMPPRYQESPAAQVSSKAKPSKRSAKAALPVRLETPEYVQRSNELQLFLAIAAMTGFMAFVTTGWWTWRRRQRVRVEIRAEAYDGRRRGTSLRNGGAAGIQRL